jgi:phosphoribosylamine-glycine ligase
VVGRGKGIEKAIESTYRGVEKIRFDGMQYRNDIGHRALAREK